MNQPAKPKPHFERLLVFVVGLVFVFVGVSMLNLPAALIVAGSILLAVTTVPKLLGR